jgi:16S rRNA (cytosine1402-N4)-methyltransferase
MDNYHKPVLIKEVIDLLQVKPGNKYIDATLGGGGHTFEILRGGATVLGIDQDIDALDFVNKELETKDPQIKTRLVLVKGNFRDIEKIAHLNNFENVSGILLDLGVSSHQIDTPERGFSFLKDGPLDMRMDKDQSITAEYLVNLLGKDELADLFFAQGESAGRAIAKQILIVRKTKAIKTTAELTSVIAQALGIKGEITDFTKNKISQKVFQALRIAVNSELESLEEFLQTALKVLGKSGRLAIISFHSNEDKIVKNSFSEFENKNMGKIITKEIVKASLEETNTNSRAKSAILRVFEKN